jgi:hypothetical protein
MKVGNIDFNTKLNVSSLLHLIKSGRKKNSFNIYETFNRIFSMAVYTVSSKKKLRHCGERDRER